MLICSSSSLATYGLSHSAASAIAAPAGMLRRTAAFLFVRECSSVRFDDPCCPRELLLVETAHRLRVSVASGNSGSQRHLCPFEDCGAVFSQYLFSQYRMRTKFSLWASLYAAQFNPLERGSADRSGRKRGESRLLLSFLPSIVCALRDNDALDSATRCAPLSLSLQSCEMGRALMASRLCCMGCVWDGKQGRYRNLWSVSVMHFARGGIVRCELDLLTRDLFFAAPSLFSLRFCCCTAGSTITLSVKGSFS